VAGRLEKGWRSLTLALFARVAHHLMAGERRLPFLSQPPYWLGHVWPCLLTMLTTDWWLIVWPLGPRLDDDAEQLTLLESQADHFADRLERGELLGAMG
jgi:hypothetical protein